MPENIDQDDAAREATISGIAALDQLNIQTPTAIMAMEIASIPHPLWVGFRSIIDPVRMRDKGNNAKKATET